METFATVSDEFNFLRNLKAGDSTNCHDNIASPSVTKNVIVKPNTQLVVDIAKRAITCCTGNAYIYSPYEKSPCLPNLLSFFGDLYANTTKQYGNVNHKITIALGDE